MALVGQARGELRPLFARAVPEFVDWLFATPMASRFIGLDQPRHVRILLEHFDLLTRGTLDQSDVDRAARIARAHQRYGIDLAYYVMGYRLIQASMAHSLQDQRQEHLADALRGLFDWDMSVVLQAYQNLLDRDALTGALTAQAFWDRVEQDLLQATTTNRAATLVVLDLDGVRRANHLEGHIAGDHLIASLGTLVQEFSASSYLVGRIGGDLFGLWTQYRELPLIRRDLESLQQQLSENHPGLTFFFGIAVLGRHGTTVSALYARADKELYRRRRAAALGGKAVSRHQSPLMSGVGQVTGE